MRISAKLKSLIKDEAEYKEFIEGLKGYAHVREPLVKYFALRIKEKTLDYDDPKIYDCPNLTEKEADNRGMRRAFREIIDLLKEGIDNGES